MSHIQSIYDFSHLWLMIGAFASQSNKQVRIFTDDESQFVSKLTDEYGRLRQNIAIHSCIEAQTFSVEKTLNPWVSIFDNQEVLSEFEILQLNLILRKFIKQIVTSKQPNNLEKLLHISQNLVKLHMSSIKDERLRATGDLAFNFVRSLFLDNVLENENITNAILTNQI